jgi:NADH dehydrogenase
MTLAMGWRNKLLVPMYWTLAFFFGRDITRF